MMYGNAGARLERARSDGFVSTEQGKVSSKQLVPRVVYKNLWWYDHSFLDRASAAADGPPTYLPTLGVEISVNKPTVDMHRSRDGDHFTFKLRK